MTTSNVFMKWVHMRATELRIELHLLVFHFQTDADSLDADFGPETYVLNKFSDF